MAHGVVFPLTQLSFAVADRFNTVPRAIRKAFPAGRRGAPFAADRAKNE
jgi:hypothetical protein